jgi:hypothetical protein
MAAVTVCVVLLSGAVDYLEERLNVHHAEYFIYVALILLGVYVIRKYLTEYRYSLFDDEVIVDRIIGSRSAPMLVLRMREIEEQGRLDELSEDRRQYVQRVVRANVRRAGCGYILFRRDEALQMLVYNPTMSSLSIWPKRWLCGAPGPIPGPGTPGSPARTPLRNRDMNVPPILSMLRRYSKGNPARFHMPVIWPAPSPCLSRWTSPNSTGPTACTTAGPPSAAPARWRRGLRRFRHVPAGGRRHGGNPRHDGLRRRPGDDSRGAHRSAFAGGWLSGR